MAGDKELFEKFDQWMTAREEREAARKDPKKRAESLLDRLEQYLDANEKPDKKPKSSGSGSNSDSGESVFDSIFGSGSK